MTNRIRNRKESKLPDNDLASYGTRVEPTIKIDDSIEDLLKINRHGRIEPTITIENISKDMLEQYDG